MSQLLQPLNFLPPDQVRLAGPLGIALEVNQKAHLARFITDEMSPAIALFCPEHARSNCEGDWYGEHAGKWLYAASRAFRRTGDSELADSLRRVVRYLIKVQEPNGYLGTYAPKRRFTCHQVTGPRTWDGAPGQRTWDIWVHSYLILGLLEASQALAEPAAVLAARKIGDLCWEILSVGGVDITTLGNHHGLSATVLIDPAVELYLATKDSKYLALAELIVRQASTSQPLEMLPQLLAGTDPAFIATGKAYQLSWNLVGLAKLHRATGNRDYLNAVLNAWEGIRRYHLTLGGGPWGGVAHRSREVFNPPHVFSPYGFVETCSTFSWIQLNRELFNLTGDAKFADEIEKSAYNDLIGAQSAEGNNWCYYSFPNGKRIHTTYWRCCKSSGPCALEELTSLAYAITGNGGIAVNLYGPGEATLTLPDAGSVRVTQVTRYPFDGDIHLHLEPSHPSRFAVCLRIPAWADQTSILINGIRSTVTTTPNTFTAIESTWSTGDIITLQFKMLPRLHHRVNCNVQESQAPDGSTVSQEVLHFEYVAITRGPLVYSTGLIDGFKIEETIRLPKDAVAAIDLLQPQEGSAAPRLRLNLAYRAPLVFNPYYETGNRADGAWRITWLQVTPSPFY